MRGLALEKLFSIRAGINGSDAPFASHNTNTPNMTRPDTSILRTLGEFQGKTTPPRSRLSSVKTVMLTIAALPNQSIFRPCLTVETCVFVVLRNAERTTKATKAAREVDPENPAPIQILSEHASQERANASGDSPDETSRC
jgi:hypothetical protein